MKGCQLVAFFVFNGVHAAYYRFLPYINVHATVFILKLNTNRYE